MYNFTRQFYLFSNSRNKFGKIGRIWQQILEMWSFEEFDENLFFIIERKFEKFAEFLKKFKENFTKNTVFHPIYSAIIETSLKNLQNVFIVKKKSSKIV